MAICRFYQQGNCKFGSNCRFEHPNANNNNNQSNQSFGGFSNAGSGGFRGGANNNNNNNNNNRNESLPYSITRDGIQKDLTEEKPTWILSSYGPGRDAPEQLFGGYPREQSFEEVRMHYYTAAQAGNAQQAMNEIQQLHQNAEQQIQTALGDIDGAIRFILDAGNKHPNRHDLCRQNTLPESNRGIFAVGSRPSTSSPFGAPQSTPASAFGQPSTLGQQANPFGASSFGQPAQQPQSAFGQPTAMGARPNPFASSAPSPFGAPSQPANPGSAFGQPSALGAKPNPFGAAAAAAAAAPTSNASPFSAFANNSNNSPSPFGGQPTSNPIQANGTPNPFGGAAASRPNPFAAASTATNSNPSPFAQAAAPQPSPFGQAQPQSQQPVSNPFAAGSNPIVRPEASGGGGGFSAFSQPFANNNNNNNSTSNGFSQQAQPNPFQQQQQQQPQQNGVNPFAAAAQSAPTPSPFTNGTNPPAQTNGAAPLPTQSGSGPYPPGSTKQHPAVSSYSTQRMDGSLATWKGQAVAYHDGKPGLSSFSGAWARIWFPDGPPAYCKDTELPDARYGAAEQAQWQLFGQSGAFGDGVMPALPPKREFCTWDF